MAFNFSPKIVTDGLVLYLDAANTRSYPGSGTTWTDLSRSGNSGALVSGSSFSNINGGSISFDGVDDYINNIGSLNTFSFVQNTNRFSIGFWFRINAISNRYIILGNTPTSAEKGFFVMFESLANYGFNAMRCSVFRGTLGRMTSTGTTNDNSIIDTNWHSAVYTINNTTSGQWYIDGIAVNTTARFNPSDIDAPDGNLSTGDSTRNLNIGRSNFSSTILPLNGNIASLNIYNRALTAQEVLQNYNATKTRFGLT